MSDLFPQQPNFSIGQKADSPLPQKKSAPVITVKKKKNNLPILLGFLALLLIGGGWYLWTAVLSKQISILDIQEGNKKVQVKSIDWQQTIFANPVFTSLSEPLEEPPIAGTSEGNPSPFTHRVKK
ncbi:MAG: hypothetical protein AAB416_00910 [Patescibacteria group bacterium]